MRKAMIHPNALNPGARFSGLAKSFAAALALAAVALAAAPARAEAQAREMLNRLVQSQGQNDPASRAFVQGRGFIDDSKWEQAAETFNQFIARYPADKNIDAALYWLAYAHSKQGNLPAAASTIDRLLQNYPRSNWSNDARKLRLEVRAKLDPRSVDDVPENADDDLRIIALRALCENDKPSCPSRMADVLRSNNSPRVK